MTMDNYSKRINLDINLFKSKSSSSNISSSTENSFLSSDDSNDFNEVEKIIEEYFVSKICRFNYLTNDNCHTLKQKSGLLQRNVMEAKLQGDTINDCRYKYVYLNESSLKNITKHRKCKTLKRTIFEICEHDPFLKSYIESMKKNTVKIIKDFILLLPKRSIDEFYHINNFSSKLTKCYSKVFQIFNEGIIISPLKSILLVEQESTKVLMSNYQAKSILNLNEHDTVYLNDLIINKCIELYNLDFSMNDHGILHYFPSTVVTLKNLFGGDVMVSIQILKSSCEESNQNKFPLLCIFEPIQSQCFNSKVNNNIITHFYDSNSISKQNKSDYFKYKLIYPRQNMSLKMNCNLVQLEEYGLLYFFDYSVYHPSSYLKTISKEKSHMKRDLQFSRIYYLCFLTNLSHSISVNRSGIIINMDIYLAYILNFNKDEIQNLSINDILNFERPELFCSIKNGFHNESGFLFDKRKLNKIKVLISSQETNGIYFLWIIFRKTISNITLEIDLTNRLKFEPISFNILLKNHLFSNYFYQRDIFNFVNNSTEHSQAYSNDKKKAKSFSEAIESFVPVDCSQILLDNQISDTDISQLGNDTDISQDFHELKEWDLFYSHFEVLHIIGKGAFGYVRLTKSFITGREYVVKFIKKSKLTNEHLVKIPIEEYLSFKQKKFNKNDLIDMFNERNSKSNEKFLIVPKEIWILCHLNHENIIEVHDWYNGIDHFQMVMPKHGIGMDLFEFIDRAPVLEENLVSYIFRQLVHAVKYLHDLSIAHRDIKDENIILDSRFNIKLIDFGAAVKVENGEKFKTFCGTMEFCSPEILLGHEYDCFLADIWSMGITLYTVMFGENPFCDFEETINAVLKHPRSISEELNKVLTGLLDPLPTRRISLNVLVSNKWINQQFNIENSSLESIIPNTEFMGNVASDFRNCSNESSVYSPFKSR